MNYDINRDLYSVPHKNYIPVHNQQNHNDLQLPLDHSQPPLTYQTQSSPYSGPLIFSETQSVPLKIIKRIRKVRVNNTNSESLLSNKNSE